MVEWRYLVPGTGIGVISFRGQPDLHLSFATLMFSKTPRIA